MPERIVYGSTLSPDAAELLKSVVTPGHELRTRGPYAVTDDDLAWATVLCCNNVPAARIQPYRNIRWLHVPAASMHAFLGLRQTRPDLRLSLTGPINARAVAEHGLALLLALRRGLPHMIEGKARATWARDPIMTLQPMLVEGSEAHVLGYGPVARALIGVLANVGARVTVFRREAGGSDAQVMRFCALRNLALEINGADAVFGVLPDLPSTQHLLNRTVLAAMKPAAVVINLGRSSLIDHAALVSALQSGGIAGAALDVFDEEPLPASSPLWTAPNLIISPHVAGQFFGAFRQSINILLREFAVFLAAGRPTAP